MHAKPFYESRNLFSAAVRGVRKFVHCHPRGSPRYAGIPRIEMLVEVLNAKADDRDMNALCPFGS